MIGTEFTFDWDNYSEELKDAIYFVDKESPASSDEDKYKMAKRLIAIAAREDEPWERVWLLYM